MSGALGRVARFLMTCAAACGGETTGSAGIDGDAGGNLSANIGSSVSTGGIGALLTGGIGNPGASSAGTGNGARASGGAPIGATAGATAMTGSLPSATGGVPSTPVECYVAVRADQCCGQPVPVTAEALRSDPCLVLYGVEYTPTTLANCPAVERCALVDCMFSPLPSRVAVADPNQPGTCIFGDECSTDADCTSALPINLCCPCPAVFPKDYMRKNPCLLPREGYVCNFCGGVLCEMCLEPTPVPSCATSTGKYRTCIDASG